MMPTVTLTTDEALVLLMLIDVPIAASAPLATALVGADAANTTPDQLRRRGLLVDDAGRTRPNRAVATALASLAQPEESLELHFGGESEHTVIVSRVRDHRVAVERRGARLSLRIPITREQIVRDLQVGLACQTDHSLDIDLRISPVAQFLLGVLARRQSRQLGLAELSIQADSDMAVRDLVVGTAVLDPGAIDRLHRNPMAVGESLAELIASGAVIEENRLYSLAPHVADLMSQAATATVVATRIRRGGASQESVTMVRFAEAIVQVRNIDRNGSPMVSLATVTSAQAASTLAALLYTDDELRTLQATS